MPQATGFMHPDMKPVISNLAKAGTSCDTRYPLIIPRFNRPETAFEIKTSHELHARHGQSDADFIPG